MSPSELVEVVAALKHDLGKYVAWRSANMGENAWRAPCSRELIEALRSDILSTHSGMHANEAAWDIWARHTSGLPRPLELPELRAVELAVSQLRDAEPALRASDGAELARRSDELRSALTTIRSELASLHRRLLERR